MRQVRFSLASLLIFVVLVAVDLAWVRHCLRASESWIGLNAPAFDMGIVSMLTVLVLIYLASKRGPFLYGFLAGGIAAMIAFGWIARYRGDSVRAYANPLVWGLANLLGMDRHGDTIIYAMDCVIFLPPQLALAVSCGILASLLGSLCRRKVKPPTPADLGQPADRQLLDESAHLKRIVEDSQ